MKKFLIVIVIIMIPLIVNKNKNKDIIKIPNDSIRVRVVANSNSMKDQLEKEQVKENLQMYLEELLKDEKTKNDTENSIKNNLSNIRNNIETTLKTLNSNTKVYINYGNNYFPKKEFKGVIYQEGYYESLVITLGKGNGNNWWCVLFPPLCLMQEDTTMNELEYKLYIEEIISKYK
ncbi:MAG: hypothetical protein E7162_02395 [Firmicutes bacterium]|nr:hypothetical protein [Bacillota bacterium]